MSILSIYLSKIEFLVTNFVFLKHFFGVRNLFTSLRSVCLLFSLSFAPKLGKQVYETNENKSANQNYQTNLCICIFG